MGPILILIAIFCVIEAWKKLPAGIFTCLGLAAYVVFGGEGAGAALIFLVGLIIYLHVIPFVMSKTKTAKLARSIEELADQRREETDNLLGDTPFGSPPA